MKKAIILPVLILAIVGMTATANSQSVTKETRNVKNFSKIAFGISGNLVITIGSEYKVVLEGERKNLDQIITEVSGEKLIIKKENWRFNFNEKVDVYVTLPALEALGVSGSGRAEIQDPVKASKLDLSVSGSGKLHADELSVTDLDCSISGSGDIMVNNGSASNAEISISGSGSYVGESFSIDNAEIEISGSGNCACNVTKELRAHVSGSGNVTYEGNPRVDAHVSGSGKVRSR